MQALSVYLRDKVAQGTVLDVLDVCSSVEAYLPLQWPARRVVTGLGMNEAELSANPALTDFVVKDLNVEPRLPFSDEQFDLVMCNLSVDYLTRPLEVVREMRRVLRKGGEVLFSFSDRVFATKAVAIWMGAGDADHVYFVASYVHFADGFSPSAVVDLSPRRNGACTGDPLYVVRATRVA